jgi:hypothetical protein
VLMYIKHHADHKASLNSNDRHCLDC